MLTLLLLVLAQDLGARIQGDHLEVRVYSARAERIELHVFSQPFGEAARFALPLARDSSGVWSARVPLGELQKAGIKGPIYYGFRAWGPNWHYDPSWKPGSTAGFVSDVDAEGNRFNPNKLLFDPYARELSHNPLNARHTDMNVYASGEYRHLDSGPVAPKGIVLPVESSGPSRIMRPFKDEIIYEAHVRGLTMNDPTVPPEYRGTYKGAAMKAKYLKDLGVTAIEFLPVHEFQHEHNDLSKTTEGKNYWGYSTLNYFSPSRRYAYDKSPGGPTRELREMVKTFHEHGIKVYLDVVYNHTGEENVWDKAGEKASLLSWRGLDNATYYELASDPRYYFDNNGVGANVNTANPVVRNMIMDSLKYWANSMGVDGFRFDLAPVLGNRIERGGFEFDKMDPDNVLNRAVRELPGVDLIAEPWGWGVWNQGDFPWGWAEWNAKFRDAIRSHLNKLGIDPITPGEIAMRVSGSADLFEWNGRRPYHSVNFITAHDGFTLHDLFSFNEKANSRLSYPHGPSDGGEDNNRSWDHDGDPVRQRQAARTALAVLMTSAGVPMITAGDEILRTQYGNNNAYNVDTPSNWIDWNKLRENAQFREFTRRLMQLRRAYPELRPDNFDGMQWYKPDGTRADEAYLRDPSRHFLGWQAGRVFVAYNGGAEGIHISLPDGPWKRVADTAAWAEKRANFVEELLTSREYYLHPRSAMIAVRPESAPARFAKREAVGAVHFAAAYLLKEALSGRAGQALRDMKTPRFWVDLGAFSLGANLVNRIPMKAFLRHPVALAAGMAAMQLAHGRFSLKDLAISTGAFLVAGAAVNLVADGLIYPILFAAGPPGWIAAGVYTVAKLAATLYLAEKLEGWFRGLLDRKPRERPREGFVHKLERLGEE